MKTFGDFGPNILFQIAYIVSQKKLHHDFQKNNNKFVFQNNGCPGTFEFFKKLVFGLTTEAHFTHASLKQA